MSDYALISSLYDYPKITFRNSMNFKVFSENSKLGKKLALGIERTSDN